MRKLLIAGCLLGLLATGCVSTPKPLYSWGNYQEKVYDYVKTGTPESMEKLMNTYQVLIDKQTGSRQVPPPGICADYGFLLYKQGKKEEGMTLMKKEMLLYPESSVFISRIIKNLENEKN